MVKIQTTVRTMAAAALGAASSAAFAATYVPDSHDPCRSVRGVITDYRNSVITVESAGGGVEQFRLLPDTGVAVNGNVGKRGNLREGMYVEVTPARDPSVATSVVARAPSARELRD